MKYQFSVLCKPFVSSVCNRVAFDADMMVLTQLIRGRTHPAGFHINIHRRPPRIPKRSNMIRSSSTLCTVRDFHCSQTIVHFHVFFACACWPLLAITQSVCLWKIKFPSFLFLFFPLGESFICSCVLFRRSSRQEPSISCQICVEEMNFSPATPSAHGTALGGGMNKLSFYLVFSYFVYDFYSLSRYK